MLTTLEDDRRVTALQIKTMKSTQYLYHVHLHVIVISFEMVEIHFVLLVTRELENYLIFVNFFFNIIRF